MSFISDDTPSDADDDLNVPTTITTQAYVEVEPADFHLNLDDDNQDNSDLKSPTESKYSCDADFSDVSPDHINNKVKKTRRKPQRTKSALEGTDMPSKTSSEMILRSRPSLPARPKLDSIINKDTGVSIVRPWSDQTISRTKQMLESDEITVLDFELMNNVAKAYMPRGAGSARQARNRLDKSIEETNEDRLEREDLIKKMDKSDFVETSKNLQENYDKMLKGNNKDKQKPIAEGTKDKNVFDEKSVENEKTKEKGISDKDQIDLKHFLDSRNIKEIHDRDKESLPCQSKAGKVDKRYGRSNRETQSVDRALPQSRERIRLKDTNRSSSVDSNVKTDSKPVEITGTSASQPILRSFMAKHSSSDSDLSEGEVVIKEPVKKRPRPVTQHSSFRMEKSRPTSAEYSRTGARRSKSFNKDQSRLHSSPVLSSVTGDGDSRAVNKPKDIGFSRMTKMLKAASDKIPSCDRTPPVTQSQESSTINLEWLFSTDSESSGQLIEKCQCEHIFFWGTFQSP